MPLSYEAVSNATTPIANIKELRERRHISQLAAANYMGVTANTIRGWERDPGRMQLKVYNRYLAALTNPDSVFTENKGTGKITETTLIVFPGFSDDFVKKILKAGIPLPKGFYPYEFVPDQPVTDYEFQHWKNGGWEPYPGFATAYNKWLVDADTVGRAWKAHESGVVTPHSMFDETNRVDPEFDENGNPIDYDNPRIIVERGSNRTSIQVPGEEPKPVE